MREIKFRAWDERNKTMFNVDVLAISKCSWDCPDFGKWGVSLAYQPHILVMQYIGRKDKNGVEIYEGDIVLFLECVSRGDGYYDDAHELRVVEYDEESASYIARHLPNEPYCEPYSLCDFPLKVIGNIYENPELLEDSK